MSYWPSFIASTLLICVGTITLAIATDSGQAWTAESARRLAVLKEPIGLPPANLINQQGSLSSLYNAEDKTQPLILMEFIYTRCPSVCLAMGAEFRRLQTELISREQQDKVKLLSISFDPQDQVADLNQYLKRFAAEPTIWSAARFASTQQLNSVMENLGVIVIPEPTVGFIHNAAVYIMKQGEVVAILDHDNRVGIDKAIQQHGVSL